MTLKQIAKKQKQFGYSSMQELINCGEVWKMEGSMGRHAMDLLRSGACMLPEQDFVDYYGNLVPSRKRLVDGTCGTKQNCINFWNNHQED